MPNQPAKQRKGRPLTNRKMLRLGTKETILLGAATLLALAAMAISDPWVFFPCFGGSWIAFVLLCILHEGRPWLRALCAVALTLVLAVIGWRAYESAKRSESIFQSLQSTRSTAHRHAPNPLLNSQLQEIKELQGFLHQDEQSDPWLLFDFANITRLNIRRAKAVIRQDALSPEERLEIDTYFKGGVITADRRYSHI